MYEGTFLIPSTRCLIRIETLVLQLGRAASTARHCAVNSSGVLENVLNSGIEQVSTL
jgi:hypothetical protein